MDTTGEAGAFDVIPGENPEMVLLDENLLKESIGTLRSGFCKFIQSFVPMYNRFIEGQCHFWP